MSGKSIWPLEEKGEEPLRVSQARAWQANGHAKDVLFERQYRKAKAKGECPNTKAAVLIDGKDAGSIFYFCQTEKCEVHNRVSRYQPTPQEQVQRKKEALAERVEKLSRVRVLEAILRRVPDASRGHPFTALLRFQQLFLSHRGQLCSAAHPRCFAKPTLPSIEFA